jgi:hypothetical protein
MPMARFWLRYAGDLQRRGQRRRGRLGGVHSDGRRRQRERRAANDERRRARDGWWLDVRHRGGRRSTSARIISKDKLPDPRRLQSRLRCVWRSRFDGARGSVHVAPSSSSRRQSRPPTSPVTRTRPVTLIPPAAVQASNSQCLPARGPSPSRRKQEAAQWRLEILEAFSSHAT